MRAPDPRLQPDEQWQAWVRLLAVLALLASVWALIGLGVWWVWRLLT